MEDEMPHFKIIWNTGYGDSWAYIEAKDKEEADKMAYEHWREDAESNADFSAEGPLDDLTKDPDHPDFKGDEDEE